MRIVSMLFAAFALLFAVALFTSVSTIDENDYLAVEGSGTCYRIAGEHANLRSIRAMARDRFLTRAECRRIYQLVDREDIHENDFARQKVEALRKFNL